MKKTGNVSFVILAAILGILFCHCVPYLSESGEDCPCKEGWMCCTEETGENLCVPVDRSCPCAGASGEMILGEMTIDPGELPADGHQLAEVAILVVEGLCEQRYPVESLEITLHSLRNQGYDAPDFIEQPVNHTDADGRAVAFIGSSAPGSAVLTAYANGVELCGAWKDAVCAKPLRGTITLNP